MNNPLNLDLELLTLIFGITLVNSLMISLLLAVVLLMLEGVWIALKTETMSRFRARATEVFFVVFTVCSTVVMYELVELLPLRLILDPEFILILLVFMCFVSALNTLILSVLIMALQGVWTALCTETVSRFNQRYTGVFRHVTLVIGSMVVYEIFLLK